MPQELWQLSNGILLGKGSGQVFHPNNNPSDTSVTHPLLHSLIETHTQPEGTKKPAWEQCEAAVFIPASTGEVTNAGCRGELAVPKIKQDVTGNANIWGGWCCTLLFHLTHPPFPSICKYPFNRAGK